MAAQIKTLISSINTFCLILEKFFYSIWMFLNPSVISNNYDNKMIGTAGHIDHGKSLLVRCSQSLIPDRLIEEQQRAMTIDMGFGWEKIEKCRNILFFNLSNRQ